MVLLRHGSRIFRRVLGSLWDIGNEEVLRRAYFQFVDETKDNLCGHCCKCSSFKKIEHKMMSSC